MTAPIMLGGGPWGPAPTTEPPPPPKKEGALKDVEQLAIFLACGHIVNDYYRPRTREDILHLWNEKHANVRDGYRKRAERLLDVWGQT